MPYGVGVNGVAFWWGFRILVICLLYAIGWNVVSVVQAADVVRIAGSGWVADAPTKIADQRGFFNRNRDEPHIRVEYYNSGKEALDALLAGEVELALGASVPVALAVTRSANASDYTAEDAPVVLASVSLSNQSHYVLTSIGRGISTPRGLVGKRVGVMFDTSAHHSWYHFSLFHRIPADAVELVDLAASNQETALVAGVVDAVVTWDPWGLSIQRTLGDQGLVFSTREMLAVEWLLVAHRGWIEQHPHVVDRVLKGYQQANALLQTEPARAREIHAAATGQSEEALTVMEAGIIWRLALNWSVLAALEATFEWLVERGTMEYRPGPSDYLKVAPLQRVAPSLVTLPDYLHQRPASGDRTP